MKVTLEFNDNYSFTVDEIVANAKRNYGPGTSVRIMPESHRPNDLVEFAIQVWITAEQVSLYYDDPHMYKEKMKKVKSNILESVGEIIDSVIKDNERKIEGD